MPETIPVRYILPIPAEMSKQELTLTVQRELTNPRKERGGCQ